MEQQYLVQVSEAEPRREYGDPDHYGPYTEVEARSAQTLLKAQFPKYVVEVFPLMSTRHLQPKR